MGTLLVVWGKVFSSESLTASFLVVAIERGLALRPFTPGAAAAGATLAWPQLFALVPILLWRLWWEGGWLAVFRATLPVAGALSIQVLYTLLRFGDPLSFGYSVAELPQGSTTPVWEGGIGLL